ncbi:MAG: hypothetical protein HZC28_04805 [Spirochaetes bacterium]|nr:hypothetical protein [Spirochaetota bacterium]
MAHYDIIYYTGTGNTAHAVDVIQRALQQKRNTVSAVCITAHTAVPIKPLGENTVIAFPVYSWMAPLSMRRYLRHLPKGKGRIYVLAVRGGMPGKDEAGGYGGGALEEVEHILVRKGYDVCVTADAGYPDNWMQFIPPLGKDDVTATCSKGDRETGVFIDKLLSGSRSVYRAKALPKTLTGIIAVLFRAIGARALGTCFIADVNCNGCSLCEKHCPTGTIVMTGKDKRPRWRFSCEACNRCINICPMHSIQFSLPFIIIGSVATGLMIWGGIAGYNALAPHLPITGMAAALANIGAVIAAVVLAHVLGFTAIYRFCFMLTGITSVRRFFSKSHTQSYGRYVSPGFKPGKTK